MKCQRCGEELTNTEGIEWAGVPLICRDCCGETEDGQPNFNGRPHHSIQGPIGFRSSGRKAYKTSTGVGGEE